MAMEVNKQLHRHARQVSAVFLAVLIIVLASLFQYRTADSPLWRGLVTQVIKVEPTANGLGKVSINSELKSDQSVGAMHLVESSGRTAQLVLNLQP